MSLPVVPNAVARRLFLDRHALAEPPAGPATGQALGDLVERLGFVQVDSVNTLARAHDLILWSRRPAYRPASLRWLNDRARGTFEHWTHDASIIPVTFYPHWRLRFARDRERLHGRWKNWHGDAFHGELDRILAHVDAEGPVSSGDFSGERPTKSTGWWDWHPSKTALEYLWRSGELAVTRREGFRKLYDLSHRVIPPEALNAHHPDPEETVDWACAAALDRLGFATSGELAAFFDLVTPAEAKDWVAGALDGGRVVEAGLEGADGQLRRSVMWPETLDTLSDLPEPPARMRVLSPFDPALRDRKRAERLFGFHYRIEIFVPEAQRRYGYYVFPVMEGDRLAGRVDMAARAGREVLDVRAFWPERGVRMGKGRIARLTSEIERAARFAGCARIEYAPDWLREAGDSGEMPFVDNRS
ncbi:winged helix DNA-binding domain-containing protein [Roseibacterium sp. SDUM158016]|uniref:winged helix-turn-helix domain-containing protein n=1 Tax=Roseicyclus sediminis TaxID=2980997 RepID=UPI0021D18632|nr:crosslink repair DNA glycosylase YcaQ family protein [Roseibacterium sp. SDUM158016]MCU4654684.1 winged helix DNA-binding domain-containing protein [Roseibacterium sp. SDUM158016]